MPMDLGHAKVPSVAPPEDGNWKDEPEGKSIWKWVFLGVLGICAVTMAVFYAKLSGLF